MLTKITLQEHRLVVWLCSVLGDVSVVRALSGPRLPGVCTVRLRSRRGFAASRVAPALRPLVSPEPRSVAFGLVKVVCTMAAGMYLGDEIGDYFKNILRSEFDFPDPDDEADDDYSNAILP